MDKAVQRPALTVLLATILCVGSCGGQGEELDVPGAPGAACVPREEEQPNFSGFGENEVVLDLGAEQCGGNVCLVLHFRGRTTCPYGQIGGDGGCKTPDGKDVSVAAPPQLETRRPSDAVYCSCRCAGPDPAATYCDCPVGLKCLELVSNIGVMPDEATGSYCLRSEADLTVPSGKNCDKSTQSCG